MDIAKARECSGPFSVEQKVLVKMVLDHGRALYQRALYYWALYHWGPMELTSIEGFAYLTY